jgi:hypothetical protein
MVTVHGAVLACMEVGMVVTGTMVGDMVFLIIVGVMVTPITEDTMEVITVVGDIHTGVT